MPVNRRRRCSRAIKAAGLLDPARWRRRASELLGFGRYLARRQLAGNTLQNAATLAYTTLLSIVPLLAVAFSVLAAFPVFEPLIARIQLFIFTNLVPATGEVVQQYIERFIGQAGGLTAAGIVGLMFSALLLMAAIDKALNDIWHVHKRRRPLHGFMVYWTVLTLSPLLIGLSVLLTTYVDALAEVFGVEPQERLVGLMPFLTQAAIFSFLYSAVPNRRVPLGHAVAGALLASLLFELAKLGFAWYVTAFPAFEVIYGALASVPLFLLWVYLAWVIVLGGAEFTQALSGYRTGRPGTLADPRLELLLALRVLGHLWRAQQHGVAITRRGLSRREPEAGEQALEDLLARLEQGRVVQRTARGGWVLARDPAGLSLLELYRRQGLLLPPQLPDSQRGAWDRQLAELLAPINHLLEQRLDVALESLFAAGGGPQAGDEGKEEAESR